MIKLILLLFVVSMTTGAYHPVVPDSCANENNALIKSGTNQTRRYTPACTVGHEHGLQQGMTKKRYRWANRVMPYVISDAFDACRRDLILEGMNEISIKTGCIQFVERSDEDDYVEFVNTNRGCYSELGRIGGRQEINLEDTRNACFYREVGDGVGSGTPAHEVIHALGFTHEHQRTDRDDWIAIVKQNVQKDMGHNFDLTEGQTLFGKYDYGSIMHYNEYAFSKNKKPTMIARKKGVVFGKADELSPMDVQKLKSYYGCR